MFRKFRNLAVVVLAMTFSRGANSASAKEKCESSLGSTTYERFLTLLASIKKDGEEGKSVEQKIHSYLKNDTRGNVFRVEGMLRLFSQHPDHGEDFEKGYKKARAFEDLLGRYADSLKFQARVSAMGLKELAGVVSSRVVEDRAPLSEFLEEEWHEGREDRWKKKYRDRFAKIHGAEERRFIFTKLASYIDDVRARDYDFRFLQEGIHEYRRRIRWIVLLMHASGGLFKLVDDAVGDRRYGKYLVGDVTKKASFSKIVELYPEREPCYLSRPLFEMLTMAVYQIGEAKDSGELVENLAAAFETYGDRTKLARRKALSIAKAQPDYVEPRPLATKWKRIIEREKILEQIHDQILACRP